MAIEKIPNPHEDTQTLALREHIEAMQKTLAAQGALIDKLLAAQNAQAIESPFAVVHRVKQMASVPVPACHEGGKRHPITPTKTGKEKHNGSMHTRLKRRCDDCATEWVVKDYGES